MISYNTLPGWSLRKSIVDLVKQLSGKAGGGLTGAEVEKILSDLVMAAGNRTAYHRYLTQVLHDMLGQGGDFLTFDDFGPINEPCTFLDFIAHTSRSGLRYLGESRLSENHLRNLAPESAEILQAHSNDPHLFQQMIDVLSNRTFRHSLLCRADAPSEPLSNAAAILKFAVRSPHVFERIPEGARLLNHTGEELARFENPLAVAFFSTLSQFNPETVPFHEVIVHMGEVLEKPFDFTRDLPPLVRMATDASRQGLISLRFEPVRFDATPPAMPNLGPLRSLAARKGQPMIDAYHMPCQLDDERKRQIAMLMDGSRTIDELTALAKTIAPDFNFPAWLKHLAARGMFAG